MPNKQALVVPAGPVHGSAPIRVVSWAQERYLLPTLCREIGTDCVDSSPQLWSPDGTFTMWVDDAGLLRDEIEHNDRAIALCRGVGYNVPDVGGVAVFTGGADDAGEMLSLPVALLRRIERALSAPPTPTF